MVLPPSGEVRVHAVKPPRAIPGGSRTYPSTIPGGSCIYHVRFPGHEWSWQPERSMEAQGEWTYSGLPPGDLIVFVVNSTGERNEKMVRVVAGEVVEVELEIP